MSLSSLAMLAAMLETSKDLRSVSSKEDVGARLKAKSDQLLPLLNTLRATGDGLVQYVNFVEVLMRQLKSGALTVGSMGSPVWTLHDRLNDRRNAIITKVHTHTSESITNTIMANVVAAHMDDFKDVVLFEKDDLLALQIVVRRQRSNTKTPMVNRKKMPHRKMAAYFHVLSVIDDAFEGVGMN